MKNTASTSDSYKIIVYDLDRQEKELVTHGGLDFTQFNTATDYYPKFTFGP